MCLRGYVLHTTIFFIPYRNEHNRPLDFSTMQDCPISEKCFYPERYSRPSKKAMTASPNSAISNSQPQKQALAQHLCIIPLALSPSLSVVQYKKIAAWVG